MTDPTDLSRDTGAPDTGAATRILSAILEPDGSISLLIQFSEGDAPVAASIDPIETTVRAAGPVRRPVELRYGHADDRLLRLVVAMHVDALAYERRERQQAPRRPLAEPPRPRLQAASWLLAARGASCTHR